MRLGKHMQQHVDPQRVDSYVPYLELKKLLKPSGSADLNHSISIRIDDFHDCPKDHSWVAVSVKSCDETSQAFPREGLHGNVFQMFRERLEHGIASVNAFVVEHLTFVDEPDNMRNLAEFAELNVTAVIKIVKKHDKTWGPTPELRELVCNMKEMDFVQQLADHGFLGCLQLFQQQHCCHGKPDHSKLIKPLCDSQSFLTQEDGPSLESSTCETLTTRLAVGDEGESETSSSSESAWSSQSLPAFAVSNAEVLFDSILGRILRTLRRALLKSWQEICFLSCAFVCHWLSSLASLPLIVVVLRAGSLIATVCLVGTLSAEICSTATRVMRSQTCPRTPVPTCRYCTWVRLSYGDVKRLVSNQHVGRSLVAVVERIDLGGRVDDSTGAESIASALPSANLPTGLPAGYSLSVQSEPTICPFCLTDFEALDDVIMTRCGHVFCADCLPAWAANPHSGGRCPVCRANLEHEEV